jgi:hypothetical protein
MNQQLASSFHAYRFPVISSLLVPVHVHCTVPSLCPVCSKYLTLFLTNIPSQEPKVRNPINLYFSCWIPLVTVVVLKLREDWWRKYFFSLERRTVRLFLFFFWLWRLKSFYRRHGNRKAAWSFCGEGSRSRPGLK